MQWYVLYILRVAVLVFLDTILSSSTTARVIGAYARRPGEVSRRMQEQEEDPEDEQCTGCCAQLAKEARLSCFELEILMAVGEMNCNEWAKRALVTCKETCGDCAAVWDDALKSVCMKMLRLDSTASAVQVRCEETKKYFVEARCKNLCEFNFNMCADPEFMECAHCGNYKHCDCFTTYGNRHRATCFGDVIREYVKGTMQVCEKVPPECWSHEVERKCGKYRYCPDDLCLLEEVVCEPQTSCERVSTCVSETGKCKAILYPAGKKCDTGHFYTREGSGACVKDTGECIGIDNKCCRHGVRCERTNPCVVAACTTTPHDAAGDDQETTTTSTNKHILFSDRKVCTCPDCKVPYDPEYTCDPLCDGDTGMCLFEHKRDGERCDTGAGWIINEYCFNGVCVGEEIDLCEREGDEDPCEERPQCRERGYCDPHTGKCSYPEIFKDGTPCDLLLSEGGKGVCVEGFCRPQIYIEPVEYLFLGEGRCADDKGRFPNRYVRTNMRLAECQEECTIDLTCEAVTVTIFAHSCELFSRLRKGPRKGWYLEPTIFEFSSEITKSEPERPGEPQARCYKKASCCNPKEESLTGSDRFYLFFFIGVFLLICSLIWEKYAMIREFIEWYANLNDTISESSGPPEKEPRNKEKNEEDEEEEDEEEEEEEDEEEKQQQDVMKEIEDLVAVEDGPHDDNNDHNIEDIMESSSSSIENLYSVAPSVSDDGFLKRDNASEEAWKENAEDNASEEAWKQDAEDKASGSSILESRGSISIPISSLSNAGIRDLKEIN